jgi:hypothetical protein
MSERYPTRHGIPINPMELGLPDSTLNPENAYSSNNHHTAYFRRMYGQSILMSTFRNLDVMQYPTPIDSHKILHDRYSPPIMPTPEQAYGAIMDQYNQMGDLRYGSLNDPTYQPIDRRLLRKIDQEYNRYGSI